MEESRTARPTLVCEKLVKEGAADIVDGEVLGAKGIQIDMLHRRMGHTYKSGLERLVREQLMRGVEDGMKGDLGVCYAC